MDNLALALSPAAMQLVVFAVVSIGVGALLLAALPQRSSVQQLRSRISVMTGSRPSVRRGGADTDDSRRRRLVEDTLRELDARQRAKSRRNPRPTLVRRMRQGGVAWSRNTYFMVCAIVGVLTYVVVATGIGLGLTAAIGFGTAAGLLLPHLYVTRKCSKRMKAFAAEFPNGLDVVVRGVKAGLPLVDCLKIIATEAQEPVRGEFRTILHDQTLGVPLEDAVERLAERVPLPEAGFFAIVIAIQSRIGGNLSEALGNLSKVLRERKNVRAKIKALSAEAKASAIIIGSMPVAVSLLLYLTSPEYIGLLITTTTGNIVLMASALWMLIGILVMRKMINFDF